MQGPQVMKKYHNRPEETENSFKDGWFKTGDIGFYNKNGYFFITDRLKELIKVNQMNEHKSVNLRACFVF